MPQEARLASHIAIFVDGTEIEGAVFQELLEVVVDQHAHLPAFFSIRLKDKNLSLLDEGPFELTKGIEIKAETGNGDQHTIIKGEITALEPHFNEGMMAELVVQGYDPSHRLFRQPHTRAHLNKKDSDLANEIAQEAGLQHRDRKYANRIRAYLPTQSNRFGVPEPTRLAHWIRMLCKGRKALFPQTTPKRPGSQPDLGQRAGQFSTAHDAG